MDTYETAAARVDFRLTYARNPEARRLMPSGIRGPWIANAYHGRPGRDPEHDMPDSPGDWEFGDDIDPGATQAEHVEAWFAGAVNEAVHEALEWFWVDGHPFLDPHGPLENAVYEAVGELTQRLIEMRRDARTARGLDPDANDTPLLRERRRHTFSGTA